MIRHSLGNMLVSAAIQDWQMPYDKYFMLNAAVPIEAYDISSEALNAVDIDRMLPREWVGYNPALKASHWHELFDESDGRRKLTWKGRFSRVNNVVNYHSSEEDVLMCGNGEWHIAAQREYAWYNQERMKGVKPFEIGIGRNEGGWGFNHNYMIQDEEQDSDYGTRVYYRRRTPVEALPLLSDPAVDFRLVPFFGWFEDRTICTNAFLAEDAISRELQSQLLADAIPAESLPAGLAPVRGVKIKTYTQRDAIDLRWLGSIPQREIVRVTDKNGMARARFICHTGNFCVYVSADGYYPEELFNQSFRADSDMKQGKCLFPLKEKTITITLLEVRNPVDLNMTDHLSRWKIPAKVGRYEFDLEKFDWVKPLGKGETADLAVIYNVITNSVTNSARNFYFSGELEFINGGAYLRKKKKSKYYYSDYNALTNETYQARFPFLYWLNEDWQHSQLEYSYNPAVKKDEYLVFRVREKYDTQGHLISANYGKIYGPINSSGMFGAFQMFFNPTTNDTNIEEKQQR